jgi:hypothetical protein
VFGKKIGDQQWREAMAPLCSSLEQVCSSLDTGGQAVAKDFFVGWTEAPEVMATLGLTESTFKRLRDAVRNVGKPEGADPLVREAKRRLDAFFSFGVPAFHWGKIHYADASGGPGQRALLETGFAQTAARKRVGNNGRQFAESALAAAKAGRAAIEILQIKQYDTGGPSFMELFVNLIPEDQRKVLSGQRRFEQRQVATIGAWLYSRAAIVGMLVHKDPADFIAIVWDPARVGVFWQQVEEEISRIDDEELANTSLGYVRMRTAYDQLYGPEAMTAALERGTRYIDRVARAQVSREDTFSDWSMDTAIGLGVGVRDPDFVLACLEHDAAPDRDSWAQAHAAGVDIPEEPDTMSVAEQIDIVVQPCRLFFARHYPNLAAKFDELIS